MRSFAVRGADTNAAMVAHVIPIRRSARDIFVRCAGVLVMTPVTLPQAPPVELVQSLFDLTPAEARVARSLTGGSIGRRYCIHWWRFAQHDPHSSAWRAGKDRLPSSGRSGCAAWRDHESRRDGGIQLKRVGLGAFLIQPQAGAARLLAPPA